MMFSGPPEMEMRCRRFLEGRGDAVAPLLCFMGSETAARAGTGAWAALIVSRTFFLKGNVDLSRAYLRVASSHARGGAPGALALGILVNGALILKARGKTREAAALLRRVVDCALSRGETLVAAKAASNCALCLVRGDDPSDAASYLGLAERTYSAMKDCGGIARVRMTRALLDGRLERFEEAVDGVARALDGCDGAALGRERLVGRLILAELYLARARLDDARDALDGAASMKDEVGRFGAQRLEWLCLESELDRRTGRMEESRRLHEDAESLARRLGISRPPGPPRVVAGRVARCVLRETAARPIASSPVPPEELFITGDPRMIEILGEIRRAAPLAAPLLITGESGVGKDVIARLVHAWSGRGREPFVPLNAAALPADLFESLAFGHARGAFTGAVCRRPGLVDAAGRGTLFLDEIGDLSPAAQAKLLRLVDRGEYIPLGETAPRRSEARVVAATNRDLRSACASGSFRADLYYRLAGVAFTIPPLRERPGDVPLLAGHFLEKARARHCAGAACLREDVRRLLASHAWPGNARELESCVLQAALRARGGPLRACHFPASFVMNVTAPAAAGGARSPGDLQSTIAAARRERIREALRVSGGNRTRAARILGLRRTTLLGMMKRLDLDG